MTGCLTPRDDGGGGEGDGGEDGEDGKDGHGGLVSMGGGVDAKWMFRRAKLVRVLLKDET